jgi:hydrogenase expression/formation protein HypC
MKIRHINGNFAEVQTGNLRRTVNIQMMPHVAVGDYVIVHVGFAIERVDPKRARETLRLIDEIQ